MVPSAPAPRLAALLMVLASAFVAMTTLLAKALGTDTLGPPLHPIQITHGRFLFALLAIGTVFAILRPRLTPPKLKLHVARTAFGAIGVTLMFAAAAFIPLSDATAISFLNPVFCMLLAIPFLGERVGSWRWAAAAIALTGALILLRPGPTTFQPAALLALGAAVILGAETILIKFLSGREGPLQILLINNILGWLIMGTAVIPVWVMPTAAQWAALAGLGFAMAAAQACFVNAMARADASLVTPLFFLTLVFAAAYDGLIFGILPDGWSLTGAAVILTGAALLAWREGRAQHRA